jgi:hypothetical protein
MGDLFLDADIILLVDIHRYVLLHCCGGVYGDTVQISLLLI